MTTPLPPSPFIYKPDERFVLDEAQFMSEVLGSDVPLFIGAPSADFIAACHRDLLPVLETYARRA